MTQIAIIYFSHTGITHQLATSVKAGAESVKDTTASLYRIDGSVIDKGRFVDAACIDLIDQSDAVCFGSPTYMGGAAAQFKAFADATSERWENQSWSGKVASGFTTGSSAGGDQLSTLQYYTVLASQHGMIWANLDIPKNQKPDQWNTLGTQLGFAAHVEGESISVQDKTTTHYLGERLAHLAKRLTH